MELTFDTLKMMLDHLPSCVFLKDTDCRYVYASHFNNNPFIPEKIDVIGKTDIDIQYDKKIGESAYAETKRIIETGIGVRQTLDCSMNNVPFFIELSIDPVKEDGKTVGVIGLINNVTERILLEKKLEAYARTDSLTGLLNRNYLEFWKSHEITPDMYPLCIISADCDGLKKINDTYGHQMGDEYLRLACSVFRVGLPEKAIKIRSGGDEFLFLIPNTSADDGKKLIEKMSVLSQEITIQQQNVSISFGCSQMNSITENFDECVKKSDEAMYMEKEIHHAKQSQK